jgi:hypothetical protein
MDKGNKYNNGDEERSIQEEKNPSLYKNTHSEFSISY